MIGHASRNLPHFFAPLPGLPALTLTLAALFVWLTALPAYAEALVLDFEAFSEGAPIDDRFLPDGVSMTVVNNGFGPHAAIVFDSACPDGCSGGDTDLQTPGPGPGNDSAQNHVLVIAENLVDTNPADGAVDDPDDERHGGSIRWFFDPPRRVASLRVIDVDANEKTGFAQLSLAEGGFATQRLLPLGNNSAQTIVFAEAPLATSLRVFLAGSGAIDDVTIDEPPPSSSTSIPGTSTTMMNSSTTSVPATSTTGRNATTTSIVTTTTIPNGICGDVTGDGRVTVADASYVLNGALDARFACPAAACDLDASGTVDVSDALATLRLAVGLRIAPSCEAARARADWN